MFRRTFLRSTATATGITGGLSAVSRGAAGSTFVEKFQFAVIDSFDDVHDNTDLEDEVEEAVDFICYAYGLLDEPDEVKTSCEPGFLSRFHDIVLEEFASNPDAYNWLLEYVDAIAEFIETLNVFPDRIAESVSDFADSAGNLTRFVPLVASIKGVLDSGCRIHEILEAGRNPKERHYVGFFKHVALTVVEVILLAPGFNASYRVAYGATGWVNRRLVNAVGRSIGWRAYSWVLSQVHWGIRIVFTEGVGRSISETVEAVTQEVVSASSSTDAPVSESTARELARSDVKKLADHTHEWDIDYIQWKTDRWVDQQTQPALRQTEQRIERFREQLNALLEGLPL